MKSDRALWEERGEIWAVLHVYTSTHARRARITRAHYRDFALFAFTTFTQGDCFIAILRRKKQGDKRKNVGDFLEKVQRFSEKVQRFWENLPRFLEKVREFFFIVPLWSKLPPKSPKLCAKDGNQYIFTSSSLEGDLAPSKRSFSREYRVWFTTL